MVLTLHTEVEGVQFDRLANLFVDGIQVWRTSTIEPGGRKVFSDFKRCQQIFQTFQKENVQILFQLDNLVTSKLTGIFDVTLTADFTSSIDTHTTVMEEMNTMKNVMVMKIN